MYYHHAHAGGHEVFIFLVRSVQIFQEGIFDFVFFLQPFVACSLLAKPSVNSFCTFSLRFFGVFAKAILLSNYCCIIVELWSPYVYWAERGILYFLGGHFILFGRSFFAILYFLGGYFWGI